MSWINRLGNLGVGRGRTREQQPDEIVRLRAKMEKLKTLDRDKQLFGAERHQYRTGDPLTKEQLIAFEQRHQLEIPDQYRQYLQYIGDGGTGPFYGLLPLAEGLFSAEKGIKVLAHEGGGSYSVLVMRGQEYGMVWYLDLATDAGAFPLISPVSGRGMGFTEWLELWLDDSIGGLERGKESFSSYSNFIK